jgi:peptidase M50
MRRYYNTTTLAMIILMIFIAMRGFNGSIKDWIFRQIIALPGIVIGLSFHEFAHAVVAYKLGDMTPKIQGRVTVNPIAHIDPFGFATLFLAGFGWGRAVEINPYNFKHRKRDELLVSFAGVTMNLFIAVVFTMIYKILAVNINPYTFQGADILMLIIYYIVYINIVLMIFNLLPIPPLDGFSIVTELFDLRRQPWYWTVYNNGFMILMIFVVTGFTGRIMLPLIRGIMGVLGMY